MNRLLIFGLFLSLVCPLFGLQTAHDLWPAGVDSGVKIDDYAWNYRYGQFELANQDQGFVFGKQPEESGPYCSACTAMTAAALMVVGTRFGQKDMTQVSASDLENAMHDILVVGAQAYDAAHKDEHGSVEAEECLAVVNRQNSVCELRSVDLFDSYITQLTALFGQSDYSPDRPMQLIVSLMRDYAKETGALAGGVILSDGQYSRILICLPRHDQFLLYDSHGMFVPDHMQHIARAKECETPMHGSFLAVAPTASALTLIAQRDTAGETVAPRWPAIVPDQASLPNALQSPVFVAVYPSQGAGISGAVAQSVRTAIDTVVCFFAGLFRK